MDNYVKRQALKLINENGIEPNINWFTYYENEFTQEFIKEVLATKAAELKELQQQEIELHKDSLFACDLKITCSELTNRCKLVREKYNKFFEKTALNLEIVDYFQSLVK